MSGNQVFVCAVQTKEGRRAESHDDLRVVKLHWQESSLLRYFPVLKSNALSDLAEQ